MVKQRRRSQRTSWILIAAVGFAAGAVMHIVAVTFALLSGLGERLLFLLTPGGLAARELELGRATWPGLVNVGLAMIANGLLYALIAIALVAAWRAARRR